MAERCRTCMHPKRAEINDALIKRSLSAEAVAAQYGLSRGSVDRHRANHLRHSVTAAADSANALTIIGYANDLYSRAQALLDRAEAVVRAEGSGARGVQAAAASLREVRASIELLAKLVVRDDVEPEQASRDSALDLQIGEALAALVVPALGQGNDIVDAEIVG